MKLDRETKLEAIFGVGCLVVLIVGFTQHNVLSCGSAGACLCLIANRWLKRFKPSGKSQVKSSTRERTQRTSKKRPLKKPKRKPSAVPKSAAGLVEMLLADGRHAVLLRPEVVRNIKPDQLNAIVESVGEEMALITAGEVAVAPHRYDPLSDGSNGHFDMESVAEFLLDRYCVTNAEFERFVDAGGYEDQELWEPGAFSAVAEFVDQTGYPGPRFWSDGTFPQDQSHRPVVGISWHEASAYARWVGKRLPSSAEWTKTASWPVGTTGDAARQRKYPWGNSFDEELANTWSTGLGRTVDVGEFADGAGIADVYQLAGNVWEWMADDFRINVSRVGYVKPKNLLKSIRGGAFDTYLEYQAACQFESADSPFARKHNIGFRCALPASQLAAEAVELLRSEADGVEPDVATQRAEEVECEHQSPNV